MAEFDLDQDKKPHPLELGSARHFEMPWRKRWERDVRIAFANLFEQICPAAIRKLA